MVVGMTVAMGTLLPTRPTPKHILKLESFILHLLLLLLSTLAFNRRFLATKGDNKVTHIACENLNLLFNGNLHTRLSRNIDYLIEISVRSTPCTASWVLMVWLS